MVRAFANDTCAGEAFISTTQTAQFVTVASACACPEKDLVFAVFVGPASAPPPPSPLPATKAARELTLDASKGKIEKGKKVRLSGGLESANSACESGQTVKLERKAKGKPDTAFVSFKQVQSDAGGEFAAKVRVRKTYIYRAVVDESQACLTAESNTQKVRVKEPAG